MKIICLIPTLGIDPIDTIRSLKRQTILPDKIVVVCGSKNLANLIVSRNDEMVSALFSRPDFTKSLGERIAIALNAALSTVKLADYDHLLRVDADILLPPDFTKLNLSKGHTVFCGGSTFFFTVKSFFEVLKGSFPVVNAEDLYTLFKYRKSGYQTKDWAVEPVILRRSSRHNSWKYYYDEGYWKYKLGFEVVHHSFASLRHVLIEGNSLELFGIMGFLVAWALRSKKLDISEFVWRTRSAFRMEKFLRLIKSREV